MQVEPAVVVHVEERDPEAQPVAARRGQADRGGMVGELAAAQVVKQSGRLVEEVGHGQLEPAITVQVAGRDAHAGLIASVGIAGDSRDQALFLETESALVVEQIIGRPVIGDEQVNAIVVVDIDGHDAEAPAVAVDDACRGGHVGESSAVVAEDMIGQRLGSRGGRNWCRPCETGSGRGGDGRRFHLR